MGCSPSVVMTSSEVQDTRMLEARGVSGKGKQFRKTSSWTDPVLPKESQKKMVANTMHALRSRLGEVGVQVFKTIFAIRPDFKQHFSFKDLPDADLEYDIRFREHAARFMQVVNCAIETIEHRDPDEMDTMFHQVGALHMHIADFQRSNFSVFKEALLHVLAEQIGQDKFKGELFRAWDAVVKYIIQRLQRGYMQAKSEASCDLGDHRSQDQLDTCDEQSEETSTQIIERTVGKSGDNVS
ncbi:uncharacterized protein [Littorina saxatilis]|uniref:uncharacterized protein n=1 Tax=Littorina saxatilis TaxID=31220 RepID=UPI0038B67912